VMENGALSCPIGQRKVTGPEGEFLSGPMVWFRG
jgi:hypothetical protein